MQNGIVKKRHRKQSLAVNKEGFASLYALLILQIVLTFVMLLLSSSEAVLANKLKKDDLHKQQLYAIYHVKAHIKEQSNIEEVNTEETQEEDNENQELPNEESEETLMYFNQPITIQYTPLNVSIQISHLKIQLEIDEDTKNINSLVYL